MNNTFKKLSIAGAFTTAVVLGLSGCSDANRAAMGAWGDEAVVLSYSGGKLTYAGISSGKIESESSSDGYYFKDKCMGNKLVEIGGDVNILRSPDDQSLDCDRLPKPEVPRYNWRAPSAPARGWN